MNKSQTLEEFGRRIKDLRRMNDWTQKELAAKCGYGSSSSNSTINKIENGKLDVPITRLLSFCEVFDVSPAYLLGLDSDSNEARKIAKKKAMKLMEKKLNEREREELIKGLEGYFASGEK